MRPLKLIHWQRCDIKGNLGGKAYIHPAPGNNCQRRFTGADELNRAKYLTPSECAAEYWRATRDAWEAQEFGSYGGLDEDWPNDAEDCYEREDTLERFATLPHAAERNYE